MKMFIANCSYQVQDFQYRLPESTKLIKQTILIGGQIEIRNVEKHDIDSVIEQHAMYGLIAVSEIDRTKPFIGLCYNIDAPVNMDKVKNALEHNMGVLDERGKIIRQEAAVSVSNAIEDEVGTGANKPGGFQALDIDIEEVGKDATMKEGIRVSRHEEPATRTRKPGRNKG